MIEKKDKYQKIIISIIDKQIANIVINELVDKGIPLEKIIWSDYKK